MIRQTRPGISLRESRAGSSGKRNQSAGAATAESMTAKKHTTATSRQPLPSPYPDAMTQRCREGGRVP